MQARPEKLFTQLWRFVLSDLRGREAERVLWHTYDVTVQWESTSQKLQRFLEGSSFEEHLSSGWWGSSRLEGGNMAFKYQPTACLNPLVWKDAKQGKDETRNLSGSSHLMQNWTHINIRKGKTWTKILEPGGTKSS